MNRNVSHATRTGLFHSANEDSFHVGDRLLIVADGMGGPGYGNLASRMTVDTIVRYLNENGLSEAGPDSVRALLLDAVTEADRSLTDYADRNPETDGMGSTVVVVYMTDEEAHVVWCGDSRAYIFSKNKLFQLTHDHSVVQQLVDERRISVDEALTHPENNVITRFVGGGPDYCVPEYAHFPLSGKEGILVCSDGLCGYCGDDELLQYISCVRDPEKIPQSLVNLALFEGSTDDITVLYASASRGLLSRLRRLFGFAGLRDML